MTMRFLLIFVLTSIILAGAGCAGSVEEVVPTPILATIPPLPSVEETRSPEPSGNGFSLSSPLIVNNGAIISLFTCDGPDLSPPLVWDEVPSGCQSLALVMDDPDAPNGAWVHWLLYNIPSDRTEIPQNVARTETVAGIGVQGKNSGGKTYYQGPCPPYGDSHRYVFTLYALDERLFLPPGSGRAELEAALEGHVLGETRMTGVYQRVKPELTCCGE